MPADPVSLCVWRDAAANPPTGNLDRQVWAMPANCALGAWLVAEQPEKFTVWCDPVPPGDDPLTTDDLQRLTEGPPDAHSPVVGQRGYWEALGRFRRTIEQQEGNR